MVAKGSVCAVSARLLFALVVLLSAPAGALWANSKVSNAVANPVDKVIQLLGQLRSQVEEEGKLEAVEYDKYACFCKEQGSDKTYAIERSDEKLAALAASIESLKAEVAQLGEEITTLTEQIGGLETSLANESATRATEHGEYVISSKNLTDSIAAIEHAIEALKDSKAQMKDAKLDFAQLEAIAGPSIAASTKALISQKPPVYEYSSNNIVGTLQKLLVDFKSFSKELDESEFGHKSASEKRVLGLSNEKKFKEKAKAEKGVLQAAKAAEQHSKEKDEAEETAARQADFNFRGELTAQCEAAAREFDQRSSTRSAELTAMSQAITILKTGVKTTYGANRKLVGLQEQRHSAQALLQPRQVGQAFPSMAHAVSFIQLSSANEVTAVRGAVASLNEAASKLHSPVLSAIAAQVSIQADHFGKVRDMINDLIAKLESEAEAEANSKTFCDEQMGAATANRDAQQLAMEKSSATIEAKTAEKAQLMQDVAALSEDIGKLSKGLNEATTLRIEEKAVNTKTLADAEAGKTAVDQAIQTLKEFYGSSLIQASQPVDREGNAVSDVAPSRSYSGDYSGKVTESGGIIGLLEMISEDFGRTLNTVGDEEQQAQEDFDAFEASTKSAIQTKDEEKTRKEQATMEAEVAMTEAQDALQDATGLRDSATRELVQLKASCVEGEESWEERKANREQEIASLKEAIKILEDWKS
mmetsp:Transcript_33122/g.72165  ORF Transcript_33122/g.72165 Transcript_33122/m.72165 type:complete len:702 (-) Transcript_33122:73-2178(-)|eukprot:CAMPEP_0170602954 /NCGR_PEP_ID=MMETSP0224-20130122/18663_1 /TAXON_ID=285029 /ORGANISM="Togula jolla, Strain CCCM 725" /LENGTH=701 /DNA_ID=CAMNT_0010927821 /DNA_START=47 /DNA_END=2152 /DNA_ORIENTATION=+